MVISTSLFSIFRYLDEILKVPIFFLLYILWKYLFISIFLFNLFSVLIDVCPKWVNFTFFIPCGLETAGYWYAFNFWGMEEHVTCFRYMEEHVICKPLIDLFENLAKYRLPVRYGFTCMELVRTKNYYVIFLIFYNYFTV
jgi:hypothetical protein